jgi:hypothetical protein
MFEGNQLKEESDDFAGIRAQMGPIAQEGLTLC